VDAQACESFDAFARRRLGALLRFAHVLTGDRHEAAALVQDGLERTLLAWPRLVRTADPEAYVRRLIVTRHLRAQRRGGSAILVPDASHRDDDSPDAGDGRQDAALWSALRLLPPRQRTVIVLRYYAHLSDREVADVLRCSVAAVRTQAATALHALGHRSRQVVRGRESAAPWTR
jgi:RNA polymerase sigma factor (sigma-70 family)